MNISPTIELDELIVLVMGIIGLTFSLIMLAVLVGDIYNILKSGVNGINKRLGYGDLRGELSRTWQLGGFIAAALIAMAIPPPAIEVVRQGFEWFKWMLVSWEVVAMINSLWAFVDRKQNKGELQEIREAKKLAASMLAEATATSEHDTALNTANAATNVADAALNVSDAAANASTAAANASDAAANAEDSLANSANAAVNAARSADITQQETGNRGK